jgi:hypothetical protein
MICHEALHQAGTPRKLGGQLVLSSTYLNTPLIPIRLQAGERAFKITTSSCYTGAFVLFQFDITFRNRDGKGRKTDKVTDKNAE